MAIRSLLEKLTSDEARAALRTAAHFVLEFVGDDKHGESNGSSGSSDAAKIVSAVAATASVAERIVSAVAKPAMAAAGKRRGGKIALGLALGAAVGAGIFYLASPKGRAKARELFHRARGWRKPRSSNGAPVEVPPPL